jgi:hypothetical protein
MVADILEEYLDKKTIKRIMREVPEQLHEEFRIRLYEEFKKELYEPPKIAFLGSAGVGKTSTINALFGANEKVGHAVAGTKIPKEIEFKSVEGDKGSLLIYDMPGVGEDLTSDKKNTSYYHEILPKCDVAVWVLSAVDRTFSNDQRIIRDVVSQANEDLVSRLVIGINKIDWMHPNNWLHKFNLPSEEQERYIAERIRDVKNKLSGYSPGLNEDRIVAYSAKQHYGLPALFAAMMRAAPTQRAWVLDSRRSFNSFINKISDPEASNFAKQQMFGYKESDLQRIRGYHESAR